MTSPQLPEPGAAPRNIRPLTGLRIVAAFWVLALHFQNEIFAAIPIAEFARPLVANGGAGVDLFFVLSGFILAHQYSDQLGQGFSARAAIDFWRARVARVYPVHFVMLNVSLILFLAAGAFGVAINENGSLHSGSTYIQNLLLVQAWAGQPYSWNGVAWSVSAEWFAYLLFPAFALALFRLRSHLLAGALVITALAIGVVLRSSEGASSESAMPSDVLLRISVAFIAGAVAQRFSSMTIVHRSISRALPLVSLLMVVGLCYSKFDLPGLFLVPFVLGVYGLAIESDPLSALLSMRLFTFGGEISYSLYMVHGLVFAICRKFLPIESSANAVATIYVVASFSLALCAAASLYFVVEKPCRKVLRNAGNGRKFEVKIATRDTSATTLE